VLRLAFGAVTVLITHHCRSVLARCQGFLSLSLSLPCTPKNEQAGNGQGVGRGHSWDSRSQLPHNIVRSTKSSGKEGQSGAHSWLWHLSSHATVTRAEALLLRERLDICLPIGSRERIPLFVLLAHAAFAVLVKLSLPWPARVFFILFSPPVLPRRGSEKASGSRPWSAHHAHTHTHTQTRHTYVSIPERAYVLLQANSRGNRRQRGPSQLFRWQK